MVFLLTTFILLSLAATSGFMAWYAFGRGDYVAFVVFFLVALAPLKMAIFGLQTRRLTKKADKEQESP